MKKEDLGDDISKERHSDLSLRNDEQDRKVENAALANAVNTKMANLFNLPCAEPWVKGILKEAAEKSRAAESSGIIGGFRTEPFDFDHKTSAAESLVLAAGVVMSDPNAPTSEIKDYYLQVFEERRSSLRAIDENEAASHFERGLRDMGVVYGEDPGGIEYLDEATMVRDLATSLEPYLDHQETFLPVIDVVLEMVNKLENWYQHNSIIKYDSLGEPFEDFPDGYVDYFDCLGEIRQAQKDAVDIRTLRDSDDVPQRIKEFLEKVAKMTSEEKRQAGKFGAACYYRYAGTDLAKTSW